MSAGDARPAASGTAADTGADYYAAFVIDPDGYRLEAYCGKHEH